MSKGSRLIAFRVSPELGEAIDAYAKETGQTVTAVIRAAVQSQIAVSAVTTTT